MPDVNRTVKIYNFAKFIYEKQEELSEEEGLGIGEKIAFDDLPEEDIKVMIGLAGSIIGYITNDLERSKIIT